MGSSNDQSLQASQMEECDLAATDQASLVHEAGDQPGADPCPTMLQCLTAFLPMGLVYGAPAELAANQLRPGDRDATGRDPATSKRPPKSRLL